VLANLLLVLSGGNEIYAFQDGAYRLMSRSAGQDTSDGFDTLITLAKERRFVWIPEMDPGEVVYVGSSSGPTGLDRAMAARVGIAIDVGDAMLERPGQFIVNLHRGYLRMMHLITIAAAALKESGRARPPESPPDVGDTALWTFGQKHFPMGRRLRVRVDASGYVHAGVVQADGRWDPVYNVPLTPRSAGGYEAVLPSGVDAFTFFWTETPHVPGHPGHWESRPAIASSRTRATS
jgi:hypothetical protein